jgi:hypothetical protein
LAQPTGNTPYVLVNGVDVTDLLKAQEELIKTKRLLEDTSKLAKLGAWEINMENELALWSDLTRGIFEVGPDFIPTLPRMIDFFKKGIHREQFQKIIERAQSQQQEQELVPITNIPEQKELLPGEKEDESSKLLVTPKKPTFLSKMLEKRQQKVKSTLPSISTDYQPLVETAEPLPEPKPLSAAERGLISKSGDEDEDEFERGILAQKVTLPPKSKTQTFIPRPSERPRGFPMELPSSTIIKATPPTQDLMDLPIPTDLSKKDNIPFGKPVVIGKVATPFINKLKLLKEQFAEEKQQILKDKQQMEEVNLIASHYKQCNTFVNQYINNLNELNQQSDILFNKLQQPNLSEIEINNLTNEKTKLYNKFKQIQSDFDNNLLECSSVKLANGEAAQQQLEEEPDEELQKLIQRRQEIVGTPLSEEEQDKLKQILAIPSEQSLPEIQDLNKQMQEPLKSVITSISSSPTDDGSNKVTIVVKVPRVYPSQLTGSISGTASELFQQMMNQPYRNNVSPNYTESTKTTIVGNDGVIKSQDEKQEEEPSLIDLSIPNEEEQKQISPLQPETPTQPILNESLQTPASETKPSLQLLLENEKQKQLEKTKLIEIPKYSKKGLQTFIQTKQPFTSISQESEPEIDSETESIGAISRAESDPSEQKVESISGEKQSLSKSSSSAVAEISSKTSRPREKKVTFEKTDMPVRQTRTRIVRPPKVLNKGGNPYLLEEVNIKDNNNYEPGEYLKNLIQTLDEKKSIKKQRTPKKYKKINKKDLKNITLKNN